MNTVSQHPKELLPDFEIARRLHKKHGTSYYFATKLFPYETRLATFALYAFFRVPDEIVDTMAAGGVADAMAASRKLTDWQRDWEKAYRDGDSADPVLRVTSYVFHRYNIPFEHSVHFLAAMQSDLVKTRYRDYDELQSYMYGSAAVVGLMMAHVIGFRHELALTHAAQLGYAMQLTNFMRDIDEDYAQRGRVYMPQDELANFGLSDEDIAERRFSRRFADFMEFQGQRAHGLYDEANYGISLLSPEGRLPVRVASSLYRAILDRLEAQSWNPFVGRARTNLAQKLALAFAAVKENYG